MASMHVNKNKDALIFSPTNLDPARADPVQDPNTETATKNGMIQAIGPR